MKKIALIGTGAGGARAPYNDASYELWSICGVWQTKAEFKRIYEVHSAKALTALNIPADKGQWMSENITHCHPTLEKSFPNAEIIGFEGHIKKYGSYFTSSLAWMLAEAIEEAPDVIEIYGVTMSSTEEYAHQKPACAYLIGWARALGIKVIVDRGAELMSAPFIYGYEEVPDVIIALSDKKKHVEDELLKAESAVFEARGKYQFLEGVKAQTEWFENNWWSGDRK